MTAVPAWLCVRGSCSQTAEQLAGLTGLSRRQKEASIGRDRRQAEEKEATAASMGVGVVQAQQIQEDLGSSSASNKRLKQDTWRD